MTHQIPSVGRDVHYVSYGTPGGEYSSACRAAKITEVDRYQGGPTDEQFIGHVSLVVFNPEGLFFNRAVLQDEETKRGGTWHWPERVG